MKKRIGLLLLILGLLILLYKDAGFGGYGGYVDLSYLNIFISLILFFLGFAFFNMKEEKS